MGKARITYEVIAGVLSVCMLGGATAMCVPDTQTKIADYTAENLSPKYAQIAELTQEQQEKLKNLEIEIDENGKVIINLQASLDKANSDIEKITDDLDVANGKIKDKDDQITTLKSEKLSLSNEINSLTEQKANVQSLYEQGLITIEERDATITDLNSQISDKNTTIEQKNAQITTLESEKQQLQSQVDDLTAQKTQLTQEIATLTQEKADLQAEVTQLESDKAELQAKVTSYDNTFADCEISLEPITFNDTPDFVYGSKVWTKHNGDIYYSDGATQYKFDKENKKWTSSGAYTNTTESPDSFVEDGSLNWYLNGRTYHSNGAEQVALGSYTKVNCTWTGVTEFSGKDVFVFNGKAYLKAGDATNGAYLYEYDGSSYTWKPVKFGQYCRYGYEVCIKKYCNLFEYNGDVYAIAYVKENFGSSIQTIKINFDNYTWSTVNSCPNSILFDENVWSDGENYYYSNNGAHYKIVFAKKTEVETTKPSTKFQYYIDSSLIDLSTFTTDVELDVTFTSCPYGHGYASSEYKSCDKIFVGIDTDSETTKYVLKFHYADKDEYVTIGSNTDGTQTSFNVTLTFDNEPTGDILTFLQSYSTRMIYRV